MAFAEELSRKAKKIGNVELLAQDIKELDSVIYYFKKRCAEAAQVGYKSTLHYAEYSVLNGYTQSYTPHYPDEQIAGEYSVAIRTYLLAKLKKLGFEKYEVNITIEMDIQPTYESVESYMLIICLVASWK